jgi:hypothetical protein
VRRRMERGAMVAVVHRPFAEVVVVART